MKLRIDGQEYDTDHDREITGGDIVRIEVTDADHTDGSNSVFARHDSDRGRCWAARIRDHADARRAAMEAAEAEVG